MKRTTQLPVLFILVTVSMLCAGFLKLTRGQNLFVREAIEEAEPPRPPELTKTPDSETDPDTEPEETLTSAPEETLTSAPEGKAHTASANETDTAPTDEATSVSVEDPGDASVPEETYAFTEVTKDYLDDALFIGDSRAEGVKLYSGWDNLTYYAEGGLTVYNLFKREVVEDGDRKITIEEALQNHSFGKIYLEIGINEMGTGTVDSFMEQYEAVVSRLRELQPDAILFLCDIMVVTEARSESDPIFNNPNIRERNERIAALADQKDIFYLNFNEVVMDENGNLNTDYTWDAVHLLGKYDVMWLDYFLQHGIVK